MRLSVIIPAYDDLPGVMTCLNSLQALAHDATKHQWLVQDDCSPNVIFPAVVSPRIAGTQRNEKNLGFAGNCNAGAKRAEGDILVFVNQDVYGVYGWSSGWDSAIIEHFAHNESCGVLGVRLLFPDGRIQSVGGLFDAKKQPFHRALGHANVHHPKYATPQPVSWVTGAVMAVRRDVWEELNGFDPVYGRGYFEDVDLCVRAQLTGYRVDYTPFATLIHSVGGTGGSPTFQQNAQTFIQRFERNIEPDVWYTKERFW